VRASPPYNCDVSSLSSGVHEHANFILPKNPGIDGLDDEHALQNAPIDERNSEERLVGILTGFPKIFEARMVLHLLDCNRAHFLRHQAREPLMDRHAQCTADEVQG
jgi:hypothetical protein